MNNIEDFKYSNKNIKEKCKEFGDILGLDSPVSENVLYGALYDDSYANALVKSKEDEDSLTMLLENPPTIANKNTSKLLKNAGMALARWAMNGFNTLTADDVEKRRKICMACPHLGKPKESKNILYKLVSRGHICKICGCKVESKVRLPDEKCPEGKW